MISAGLLPLLSRRERSIDPHHVYLARAPYPAWERMAGVRVEPNRLRVVGINRQLSPLPDSGDDPVDNPAVNNDVALSFVGDFSITTVLDLPDQSDLYLEFWGLVPMVQDEWRAKNNMISFEFRRWGGWSGTNGTIYWTSHDLHWAEEWGDADIPMGELGEHVTFTLQRIGKEVSATCNGVEVFTMTEEPDRDFFPDKQVYLSAYEGRVGESSYIISMEASSIGSGSSVVRRELGVRPIAQSTTSLRTYAQTNYPTLRIGSTISINPLTMDPQYAPILGREFNQITMENSLKFQTVQPQRGVFEFGEADMMVEYALKNNTALHGHTLVWDEAIPMWIHNGSFTDQEVRDIMEEHIHTVVSRYAGVMESWDVINEPFEGFTADLRNHIWYRAMGRDYIKIALQAAHAADPNTLLFINEWGVEEQGTKQDAMIELFEELLADNVPIHGVGLQMHEDMNADYQLTWPPDTPSVDKEMLKTAIARYRSVGITARISELDVNVHREYPTTRQAFAEYYRDILEACIEEGIHTLCMWGFTDRWSSAQDWWDYFGYVYALIYDVDYQPKEAYNLMNLRLQQPPS